MMTSTLEFGKIK